MVDQVEITLSSALVLILRLNTHNDAVCADLMNEIFTNRRVYEASAIFKRVES